MDTMQTTLCLFKKESQILLGMKKRGFGAGKYNGIGGKLEKGETPEEAMIRECQEEIGLTPTQYEKVGYLDFEEYFQGNKEKVAFYLYLATEWEGSIKESEEMRPEWFATDKIPYDKMFVDDRYWLPLILEGKKIKAHFKFDENWNILFQKIEEL